jgi:hypothetical protein
MIDEEQTCAHSLGKMLNARQVLTLAQSGAREWMILLQVIEAIKRKPDLIVVGHTSEFRWQYKTKGKYTGVLLADFAPDKITLPNQALLGSHSPEAWHGAGVLLHSEESLIQQMWAACIAYQIALLHQSGIPHVHHLSFGHLQIYIHPFQESFVLDHHLNALKRSDLASDGSHAGAQAHLALAVLILKVLKPLIEKYKYPIKLPDQQAQERADLFLQTFLSQV